jgi:hypothetical protein
LCENAGDIFAPSKILLKQNRIKIMPNNTRHALDSAGKHGLDNLTEGMADTLDGWTSFLADLLGSLGAKLIDHLDSPKDNAGDKSKGKDAEKAEFCAVLASWEKLENDPAKKAVLAEAAKQCRDHLKADEKEKANYQEPQAAQQDRDEGQALGVERVIQVPEYIRDNPMYEQILAAQRESIAAEAKANTNTNTNTYQGIANQTRIEAAEAREHRHEQQAQHEARQDPATPGIENDNLDPYEKAAQQLDAKPLKEGQEFEGQVVDIAKVDGKNYYVVEQDGERIAVPAGDKPEHDMGDEITTERTKGGFETADSHDYGR